MCLLIALYVHTYIYIYLHMYLKVLWSVLRVYLQDWGTEVQERLMRK